MAVITYSQDAVLAGYQQWAMQQGAAACLDRITRDQQGPQNPLMGCGPYAQQGTQVRYTVRTTLPAATVFFAGQFQNSAGMWQNVGETVQATSAGGTVQVIRPATQGNYANMVASVGSATVGSGEAFAMVELGRTNNGQFVPYAKLVAGYVETTNPIDACSGSHTQNTPSTSSGGTCVCTTTLALQAFEIDPGGQAAFAERTPAAGTKERIIVAVVTASTDVLAGNRALRFDWRDLSVGQLGWIRTGDVFGPGISVSLNGYVEVPSQTVLNEFVYLPLPSNLYMQHPYNMNSDIEQFQTGDAITDTYAVIEITS